MSSKGESGGGEEQRGVMLEITQAAERVYGGARRGWREIDADGFRAEHLPIFDLRERLFFCLLAWKMKAIGWLVLTETNWSACFGPEAGKFIHEEEEGEARLAGLHGQFI